MEPLNEDKFTYYITVKKFPSTAIVTHVVDWNRAKQIIGDWTNNIRQYDLFQVLKK